MGEVVNGVKALFPQTHDSATYSVAAAGRNGNVAGLVTAPPGAVWSGLKQSGAPVIFVGELFPTIADPELVSALSSVAADVHGNPELARILIALRGVDGMALRLGADDARVQLALDQVRRMAAELCCSTATAYGIVDEPADGNRRKLDAEAAERIQFYLWVHDDFARRLELTERLAEQLLASGG